MVHRHIPETLGKYLVIKDYLYDCYEGNMDNRKSHSGIIIYVNNVSIIWYSKHHNKFEASISGLEFVVVRIATDVIEGMRHKLRCF